MPRTLGLPKYWDHAKTEPGTVLVKKGRYIGTVDGQYGPQHRFEQLDDHQEVVIGGGSLNWRADNGYLNQGEVYDVIHDGMGTMEKGTFLGKQVKNFKIAVYDKDELGEAPVDVDNDPEAVEESTVPADQSVADPSLNDLE